MPSDLTDIVERLRGYLTRETALEAADEIERLRGVLDVAAQKADDIDHNLAAAIRALKEKADD